MTNENAKTKKLHWKDVDLDELLNYLPSCCTWV